MKPLHQFWHALKLQFLASPIQIGGCVLACLIFGRVGYQSITIPGNAAAWEQYPGISLLWVGILFPCVLIWGLPGTTCVGSSSAFGIADGSLYAWMHALDRQMIFWSKLLIYAAFVIGMTLPVVSVMQRPDKSFQMSFQGIDDQGGFQKDLLSDQPLGAHLHYDQWKNILIDIPKGRELQMGLVAFEMVVLSLLILWIALHIPLRWSAIANYLIILPLLPGLIGTTYQIFHSYKSRGVYIQDSYNYRLQFMTYAKHESLAWVVLFLVGILVIWSAKNKYLRPQS